MHLVGHIARLAAGRRLLNTHQGLVARGRGVWQEGLVHCDGENKGKTIYGQAERSSRRPKESGDKETSSQRGSRRWESMGKSQYIEFSPDEVELSSPT